MVKQLAELRRAPLFSQADDSQLAVLAGAAHETTLATGDTLFTHGQVADRFFLVRSGQIKLYRISPEGQEKIIEIIGPGQTFAEAVMFMGAQGHYPVSAQAMTESRLFAFDQKHVLKVLSESPEICLGMLAALSRRLHMLVNQIDGLTLQNATYRLALYLLEHVPADRSGTAEMELPTTKAVIAAQLAIQPETFSRILAKLKRLGLIEVNGNHVALRDLRGLRNLAYLPASDDGS